MQSDRLWQAPERLGTPLAGSALVHFGIAAVCVGWAFWLSAHHGSEWGSSISSTGAIQATLVSNAPSIPIPSPQTPTDNVLATETPSPAPAPPAPAAKEVPPPDAIPIPEKVKEPPKVPEKPKPSAVQTKPVAQAPPATKPLTHPLPIPKTENRANFGEAAPANIPRSSASSVGAGPVSVAGDFGSRFGWYVDVIKRKAQQNWYKAEVDPRTAGGAKAFVTFDVARDGTPSHIRIEKSSGSPSLDSSALRALQRVDTFGPLPAGYNGNQLSVEYYFEF
jgi:protein TonB